MVETSALRIRAKVMINQEATAKAGAAALAAGARGVAMNWSFVCDSNLSKDQSITASDI